MKYFISIALSPEQYCIGIALTEWVTKWSKEYFIIPAQRVAEGI